MTAAVITTIRGMSRWEPNARGRLEEAALDLFAERGFEQTTVAEIAERAGLTERTFFRHFADKREVLFGGGKAFEQLFVAAVAAAPASETPLQALAPGLEAAGAALQERRDYSRRRQAIIAANPELQERELIKLAALASALAEALRRRGVDDLDATLAAEIGVAVFRTAFERWQRDGARSDLRHLISDSLAQAQALAGSSAPA
jgi:AcrR family transcriptional regulator